MENNAFAKIWWETQKRRLGMPVIGTLALLVVLGLLWWRPPFGQTSLSKAEAKRLVQTGSAQAVAAKMFDGLEEFLRENNDAAELLLAAAAKNSDPGVVGVLLAQGVDVNATGPRNRTALMEAALHNPNPEMTRYLLSQGANPAMVDATTQRDALMLSTMNPGPAKLVHQIKRMLFFAMGRDAVVKCKDIQDKTFLMYEAANQSDPEMIGWLLNPLDTQYIELPDQFNHTAIMHAAMRQKDVRVIEHLFELVNREKFPKAYSISDPINSDAYELAAFFNPNRDVIKNILGRMTQEEKDNKRDIFEHAAKSNPSMDLQFLE